MIQMIVEGAKLTCNNCKIDVDELITEYEDSENPEAVLICDKCGNILARTISTDMFRTKLEERK